MNIIITRYEVTNGDYTYTVSHMPGSSGKWTMYRRLTEKPNIPPYKQVFTSAGWQPVINHKGQVELFASIEEVTEEIQGDTR